MAVALLALVLAILVPSTASAQDLGTQFDEAIAKAERAVAGAFARSLPIPGASPGVTYSFDPATGSFRREPVTFGQVYLDRAAPLGAGRFNVGLTYQYAKLEEIEGRDASDLGDPLPIPLPGLLAAVQIPRFSIDAAVHQFLFSFAYGLTEDIDVGVAVPLEYTNSSVQATLDAAAITEEGELFLAEEVLDDDDQVVGVGDVLLRGKYRFLAARDFDLATALLLRFPSGSMGDLQGIGYFEVTPSLLASTRIFEAAPWARLQGHLNAAVGFNTEDVDSSEARWGIGGDWAIEDAVTLSIAFLARNQFADIASPESFLFTRCDTDLITCAADPSVRDTVAPIFGLTGERPDYYNFSIGGRGALWQDTVFLFANVAIPLNDGFVRTAPIPLIGLEGTF
jgi:hypothetical protein